MIDKRMFALVLIVIVFALIAYDTAINIPSGTNGTNAAGGEIAYYLHNTSSDIVNSKVMNASLVPTPLTSYVNVSNVPNGDTLLMNWTTPSMNITSMPAGVHVLHITVAKTSTGGNHDDYIYYKCASVNATGALIMSHGDSELSAIFLNGIPLDVDLDLISTSLTFNMSDRMFIQVYVRQTGTGNLPDVQLRFDDLTDSRLILPSNAFTSQDIIDIVHNNTLSDNTKVNKSGDTMTDALLFDSGKGFRLNDTSNTRSLNYDMNINSAGSSATYVYVHPEGNNQAVGMTFIPKGGGYTAGVSMFLYQTDLLADTINWERGTIQMASTTGLTFNTQKGGTGTLRPITFSQTITITPLSGSGNAAACIDSSGKLYRSTNATSNYLTC